MSIRNGVKREALERPLWITEISLAKNSVIGASSSDAQTRLDPHG